MSTATELLFQTARRGELHHALILHGVEPATLRDTAVSLAKTLNCENNIGGDDCTSCTKIDRGVHPDVHFVGVADERKMIAVEQIREMIAGATLRPYEGRTKIYIVESAEAMSTGGANALLKTLEEPTRDTLFLLLTRSPELLLPTIRSRCQSIQLRDAETRSAGELAGEERMPLQLAKLTLMFPAYDPVRLKELALLTIEALAEYASGDAVALLRLASEFGNEEGASDALALFAALLRDIAALPPEQTIAPRKIEAIRAAIEPARLFRAADVALRGVMRLVVNIDLRLQFEAAVVPLTKK